MRKAVMLAVVAVALAFVGVAVAGSGHTVTETQTLHVTGTGPGGQPCSGDPLSVTETTNLVSHETFFPGGDEAHGTLTEEDKIMAVDEINGVVYSGHNLVREEFNINNENSNDTFTNVTHVRGTDGSSFTFFHVGHEAFDRNGNPVVQFDKETTTCG